MKARAAVCNLKLLNPGFDYLFFDDAAVESFIEQQCPEYRTVFVGFPFRIQRYDFFRYLAIYHYGGFYFDLDLFLVNGLGELLDAGAVFSFEGLTFSRHLRDELKTDWQIGNYAFGAAAGHPFLEAVIENCVRGQKDPAWVNRMMMGAPGLSRSEFLVLNSTGPGLLTRTLVENPALGRDITVLFPDDVCDVSTWNRFGELGIHLMDGSWRTKGGVRRRLAMYWERWRMSRLLQESRQQGGKRTWK